MSQFTRTRIRCAIWPAKAGTKFETTAPGGTPKAFKAAGMEFEFAFFDLDDVLLDVSNIASITVSVKPANSPGSAPEMLKTVVAPNINAGLELVAWQNGTGQHVVISFLGSETTIAAGLHDIFVSGFTTDNVADPDVFGVSTIEIIDAGLSNLTIPPLSGQPAATVADIVGILAGFAKKVMGPGETITFTSDDTKVKRILGAGNANPAGATEPVRVDDIEIES